MDDSIAKKIILARYFFPCFNRFMPRLFSDTKRAHPKGSKGEQHAKGPFRAETLGETIWILDAEGQRLACMGKGAKSAVNCDWVVAVLNAKHRVEVQAARVKAVFDKPEEK